MTYSIHRSLRAVDNNILLSHLQQRQCAGEDEFFKDADYIEKITKEYPWLFDSTKKLLDDCDLQFDVKALKTKRSILPADMTISCFSKNSPGTECIPVRPTKQ